MLDPILSILSLVISAVAAVVAYVAWKTARQQTQDALWAVRFNAYMAEEMEANTDAFLAIHGVTENELSEHGLTKETFRAYLLRTNAMWTSAHRQKDYRKIEKTKDYEEKVTIARVHTWDENTANGRVIQSQEFERAWPLIRRFWDTGEDCVMAALIEAGVRRGIEFRNEAEAAPQSSAQQPT